MSEIEILREKVAKEYRIEKDNINAKLENNTEDLTSEMEKKIKKENYELDLSYARKQVCVGFALSCPTSRP